MAHAIDNVRMAMMTDLQRLTLISQNVANITTPGYRSRVPVALPFETHLAGTAVSPELAAAHVLSGERSGRGNLTHTGDSMDLAVSENGYIVTQKGDVTVLRESVRLTKNASGVLTALDGAELVTDAGPISVTSHDFTVDHQGRVWEFGRPIGQLQLVVKSDDAQTDTSMPGFRSAKLGEAKVLQGSLVSSSVNPTDEMTQMIELTRHFEMSQRILRTADSMSDTAVNVLGDMK